MKKAGKNNKMAFVFFSTIVFYFYGSYLSIFSFIDDGFAFFLQLSSFLISSVIVVLGIRGKEINKFFLVFFVFFFLSIFYVFTFLNDRAFHDFGRFASVHLLLLVALIQAIGFFRYKEQFELFFKIYVVSSFFVLVLVLFHNAGEHTFRLGYGSDTNPIWVARAAGVIVLYACANILFRRKRFFWFVVAALSLFAVLLTGSRGPLVAIVFSIFCLAVFFGGRLFIVSLVTVFCFLILIISNSFGSEYIGRALNFESFSRVALWNDALNFIGENPSGWGAGSFDYHVKSLYGQYPHNFPLELFFEFGFFYSVFIFVLIFWSFVFVFLYMKRVRNLSSSLFFVFLIYHFTNTLFSGNLLSHKEFYFFFVLGLVISLSKESMNKFPKSAIKRRPSSI